MKTPKVLFWVLLGAAWWAGLTFPADAQVFLEEGKVKQDVLPGENIAGKLTLHNTLNTPVTMRVYWEDFAYVPPFDGTKEFLPRGSSPVSMADWVNVGARTMTFDPFSKKTISYTINVPKELNEGHYGVLFFEKQDDTAQVEKGLTVVTRVGCLFFIEPRNKSKEADIGNFRISGQGLGSEMTNKGNVILIPDGSYYVIDAEGNVFDRGTIQKIYLPPGKTADYPLEFHENLPAGTYTLVMNIELEDKDVIVREIDFQKSHSSSYTIIAVRD